MACQQGQLKFFAMRHPNFSSNWYLEDVPLEKGKKEVNQRRLIITGEAS